MGCSTQSEWATACLILAAGAGKRLGGGGKALVELGGVSLAVRALRTASTAGTRPFLVLGHQADLVEISLHKEAPELLAHTQVLQSGEWDEGMSASFRAGVGMAAATPGVEQIAVLLVDQPGIGTVALRRVLQSHTPGRITRGAIRTVGALRNAEAVGQGETAQDGAAAQRDGTAEDAASAHSEDRLHPVHPVVFDVEDALAAAQEASGDEGARRYIRQQRDRVQLVDITDMADPADIDTGADLEAMRRRFR